MGQDSCGPSSQPAPDEVGGSDSLLRGLQMNPLQLVFFEAGHCCPLTSHLDGAEGAFYTVVDLWVVGVCGCLNDLGLCKGWSVGDSTDGSSKYSSVRLLDLVGFGHKLGLEGQEILSPCVTVIYTFKNMARLLWISMTAILMLSVLNLLFFLR